MTRPMTVALVASLILVTAEQTSWPAERRPLAPKPAAAQPDERARDQQAPGERPSREGAEEEAAPAEEPAGPSPTDFAGTFGAAAGPQSAAPYMIGDFFGGTSCQATVVRSFTFTDLLLQQRAGGFWTVLQDTNATPVASHDLAPGSQPVPITAVNDASGRLDPANPLLAVPAGGTFLNGTTVEQPGPSRLLFTSDFDMAYQVYLPSPGNGGGVGGLKIADNTSPLPRDRLILDYSYFDNVPLFPGGVNVNRLTAGFEKSFCDGQASFELKAPMASTLDHDVTLDGPTSLSSGEFGNLSLTVKALLTRCDSWATAAGLQVGVPTAADTRVVLADGTPLIAIRNDAVHLGPFFGALWTPSERLFSHAFIQCDLATAGNAVLVNLDGRRLSEVGRLNDRNLLYVDWGIGYWSLRNTCRHHCLTGVAWTGEVHWSGSLQHADTVTAGNWAIGCDGGSSGGGFDDISILDLTIGAHLEFRRSTLLTLGYSVPVGAGRDEPFDGELRVLLNHHFGPANRLARTP